MPESSFQLDHLNLPARDPEGLARWYAETFGLRADAHRVRAQGVLLVFQPGEPVNRAPDFHLGMRLPSMRLLGEWARQLGGSITAGPEFSVLRVFDPEGNCIELYARSDS